MPEQAQSPQANPTPQSSPVHQADYQGPPAQAHQEGGSQADEGTPDSIESAFREIEAAQAKAKEKGEGRGEGSEREDSEALRKRPPQPKASVAASLHRREQELVRKQQAFAERERAVAEKEAAFAAGQHSPMEALRLLGYEDGNAFIERIAETGGEMTPEQREIYELKQWKAKQEEESKTLRQRQEEEAQAAQYRQEVDKWHNSIANYVQSSEQWKGSLVALPGTEQAVFDVINEHFQETKETLEFDDAIARVAEQAEERLQSVLQQIAGNPRGLAILQEHVAKLAPQASAKRGKSAPAQQGISQAVRNQTRSAPPGEDLDLDAAVAANARWLSEQSRR